MRMLNCGLNISGCSLAPTRQMRIHQPSWNQCLFWSMRRETVRFQHLLWKKFWRIKGQRTKGKNKPHTHTTVTAEVVSQNQAYSFPACIKEVVRGMWLRERIKKTALEDGGHSYGHALDWLLCVLILESRTRVDKTSHTHTGHSECPLIEREKNKRQRERQFLHDANEVLFIELHKLGYTIGWLLLRASLL